MDIIKLLFIRIIETNRLCTVILCLFNLLSFSFVLCMMDFIGIGMITASQLEVSQPTFLQLIMKSLGLVKFEL